MVTGGERARTWESGWLGITSLQLKVGALEQVMSQFPQDTGMTLVIMVLPLPGSTHRPSRHAGGQGSQLAL